MMLAAHQGRWVQQVCSGLSVARVKPHATFHWPPLLYLLPRQPGQGGGTAYLSKTQCRLKGGCKSGAFQNDRVEETVGEVLEKTGQSKQPPPSGHRRKLIDPLRRRPR
jgi:hypothetical protein